MTNANERSKTRAASGIVIDSAASAVIALALRICFAVAEVRERLRHPEREQHDDPEPDVDRADAVEGEAVRRARFAAGGRGARRRARARRAAGSATASGTDVRRHRSSPSMALTSACSVSPSPPSSAATRPSRRTTTRVHMASRSPASDDETTTVRPLRDSSRDQVVDGDAGADVDARGRLAEDEQRRARAPRQRATTTFCWLPPLSVEIGAPGPGGDDAEALASTRSTSSRLRALVEPSRAGRGARAPTARGSR